MADINFASGLVDVSIDQVLALEEGAERSHRFAGVDKLMANLITAALSGSKVIQIEPGVRGVKNADTLTLPTLSDHDRTFVTETFALANQQARGAWLLPEQATLKAGAANMPSHLRRHPLYAITMAADDVGRVRFESTPDSVTAWALLVPMFDALMGPIVSRAVGSTAPPDEQQQAWSDLLDVYQRLGLHADPTVTVFAYRGGWGHLDRAAQVRARLALVDSLSRYDPNLIAKRFRAARVQTLVAAVASKARRGTPLARRVLTRALQPVLSAYFAGDWLSFLDYLGLPPNPDEEIITALPQPKLYVSGSAKADTVAAEHGLPVDDVHAMLAAFMGQSTSTSPIEVRADLLARWWEQFDEVHAKHTSGMTTLWGLIEDGFSNPEDEPDQPLYRQLLSSDLVTEIDQLWDGITLARWPETIVSEPYPHRLMAETLGAAVTFWHGVALTCWYVCEGPYSRTPLSGLSSYHERDLAALAAAGSPVHPGLFEELIQAEQRLGPLQFIESTSHELQLPDGNIGIRFSGGGQRRDGYEILRDIVTRHRRDWAHQYLPDYIRYSWEHQLSTVARELHRHIAAKGKAPTFRQFAKFAASAANQWFNGDLAGLYAAIGEKSPATSRRIDLLPTSAHEFVRSVYTALGGESYSDDLRITDYPAANRFRQISRLASASLYYVQVFEALGRSPEPSEFGAKRYEWDWAEDFDQGWSRFKGAVTHARSGLE